MKSYRKGIATCLVALIAVVAHGAGAAQAQADVHQIYSDDEIASAVRHMVRGLNLRNLDVSVVSGLVTLRGESPSLGNEREAVKRAGRVHDVRDVVNEMSVYASVDDTDLHEALTKKLERYVHYTIYDDVEATVHDGRVTLSGRVTDAHKVTEIEDVLAKIDGVRQINNELRILPDSRSDERVRIAVAVEIYRLFPHYAVRPAPRIHVVVENGAVTLTGTVRDFIEKHDAETTARDVPGVLSVENRLTTELS